MLRLGGKCAVAMQPRLWAAITTGPYCSRMVRVIEATQALRDGVIQSSCRTRTVLGPQALPMTRAGVTPAGNDDDADYVKRECVSDGE